MKKVYIKIGFIFFAVLIISGGFFIFYNDEYLKFKQHLSFENLKKEKILMAENIPEVTELKKDVLIPEPPMRVSEDARNIPVRLARSKIIHFTNLERENNNRAELKESNILNKAALKKLNDMLERQYFAHISPSGTGIDSVVKSVGYKYLKVGENLALGDFNSEKYLVSKWIESPGHRKNILNKGFSEIGVATKKGNFKGRETFLAVQVFGSSILKCSIPGENLELEIINKKNDLKSFIKEMDSMETEIENINQESEEFNAKIENLISRGNFLINQGNDLIEEGNNVYKNTQDETKAEESWNQGEALQKEGQEKIASCEAMKNKINSNYSTVKIKINEYNVLISMAGDFSNKLKVLILDYNSQVEQFNACIES